MRSKLLLIALLGCSAVAYGATTFDGTRWWGIVKVLADDRMEGRETGSPGERQAQEYIVEQLKLAGIAAGTAAGYYQPVKLRARDIVEAETNVALVTAGQPKPLTIGEEIVLSARVDLAPMIEAPLVFVGYGLDMPDANYHDFSGLDLKGKIAVYVQSSPARISSALSAHYQSLGVRWKALRAAGAVGILTIPNPSTMDIPWPRIAINRSHPSMYLVGDEFNETADARFYGTYNPAFAEQLFAGTKHTFKELAAIAKDRKSMPHFPLQVSLRAKMKVNVRDIDSNNVVARIPGSDPTLATEYVALSAHIDHIGVGEPINGDRINNGAMDNGSGSALLLEVGRAIAAMPVKPKRSTLLVWVTAEEKGLLGSRYFAAHPTAPISSIVANINTDQFLPIVPLHVLTVYGLAESDLGDRIERLLAGTGIKVRPDPQPLRNVFIRSDQYNFVRKGIPSVMMDVGAEPESADDAVLKKWLAERYHAPSDDINQPVDLATATRFEEITLALTLDVANDPKRPAWKPGSFFRRFATTAH